MKLAYDEIARLTAANNRSGQDDALIVAMCYKESGFDPTAKNPTSSAAGLMGVTRVVVTEVNRVDKTVFKHAQVYLAADNIELGSRYLRIMIGRWGAVASALDHYGTGAGYDKNLLAAAAGLEKDAGKDPMGVLVREISKR